MTTETPLATDAAASIKVTVTEEVTTTYLVTPTWLDENGFPSHLDELGDHLTNGTEYAPEGEDPVDHLAVKLSATHDVDELSVTERDVYLSPAE